MCCCLVTLIRMYRLSVIYSERNHFNRGCSVCKGTQWNFWIWLIPGILHISVSTCCGLGAVYFQRCSPRLQWRSRTLLECSCANKDHVAVRVGPGRARRLLPELRSWRRSGEAFTWRSRASFADCSSLWWGRGGLVLMQPADQMSAVMWAE